MGQGFAVFAGIAPDVIRTAAHEAERCGYSSFWVNHPGTIDGLAALAVAAKAAPRIELGIGVIPLHTRAPDSIVQGVREHDLPLGRLLLGVGSPKPAALARVRTGIAALRAELPVRLVVAALGPQMCRVAGEVADGVLFNWLTPEHARLSGDWVRAGAEAAGRKAPKLFAYVRVALGSAAHDRLREEADRYARIPAYADHFARMGVKSVDTAIAVETPDTLGTALARWRGVVDEVVLRGITATDTVDETVALVKAARPA